MDFVYSPKSLEADMQTEGRWPKKDMVVIEAFDQSQTSERGKAYTVLDPKE